MTRDETLTAEEVEGKNKLKQEAREWCKKKNLTSSNVGYFTSDYCEQSYIAGAEPREKQIEIDAEQIRNLQKQNGELTDKVKELEAQIEKMKCCGNCAKNGHICIAEEMQGKLCGKNKVKWQLRR